MQRIQDGRRDIIVHGDALFDDLPVDGIDEEDLVISGSEPFTPANMSDPKIYPGDVIVGFSDGGISFVELVYDKVDEGVLVVPLSTGEVELTSDSVFAKRFYQEDEIHIYDDITTRRPDFGGKYDVSKLKRPEVGRAR